VGEEIPFLARVLHVADAFEAMTAVRPYRKNPLTTAQAMEELRKYTGIQFDPRVVDAFARTRTAQTDRTPSEPDPEPVIPSIASVAARRARGTASAAVRVPQP
jgi:HD-GYP domain-containing protein (c-di-GMP phosphodiesterase class II)